MPTALIADDEPLLLEEIASQLAQLWPELRIVAQARNGAEALAALNREQPDYAFLDIRMPGLTGLDVARNAPGRTRVVFVTAYDAYALAAFDASAVDYLLKPLETGRLAACIAKLQRSSTVPDWQQALQQAQQQPAEHKALDWLTVGLADTTRLVAIGEVIYFESNDKYTEVVTRHERHLMRTPLKALLPQLPEGRFAQIHRSVIVSLPAVDRIERDLLGRLRLFLREREESFVISRTFAGQFRQM
ncbi:two component transcriptional regulator, LytTR family [Andreprevotia lacus DSM 23236]|jgi:DNA-binding LytR/AlgR family response regulator|uniref:Two component transcriptional regulator, LytTR family n=1 Tax=Andreprevotia lacus DSM 23236 TaxID=1121001 RepID=A0A1W1XD15_9NEIS|nr:LytTR family DNA-binding domain-containing protein [Andreprevotia lacus]SMC21816.1 two component transcriptional regulator, LytTR family [Andreprevotia lacus DSM 23236]